jgi:serine O-acetyltransferase
LVSSRKASEGSAAPGVGYDRGWMRARQTTTGAGAEPQNVAASTQQLRRVKRMLERIWIFSPERLWLLSSALHRRGHWLPAFAVKQFNTLLYHNSLAPDATVAADVKLGHYSHGIVVNGQVEIGAGVKLWHNVTLTAGRRARRPGGGKHGPPARIVIEDGVRIGANAVVIAPRGELLRIGRGAKIGAGAVVTHDVPARAIVVNPPARILPDDRARVGTTAADVQNNGAAGQLAAPDRGDARQRGEVPNTNDA